MGGWPRKILSSYKKIYCIAGPMLLGIGYLAHCLLPVSVLNGPIVPKWTAFERRQISKEN